MKKTLVALAVLAASGASFAQATITGQLGFGIQASKSASGADAGGLGFSDSNITFAASEDLGGGMKVAGNLKLDGVSRKSVNGGDESVSLSGAFGTFSGGLTELDIDVYDQFGTFMGGTALGGRNNYNDSERRADFVKYETSVGPVGLSIRHTEAEANQGIGSGGAGSNTQRLNTIAASYAAGALSLKADYSSYDNKDASISNFYDNRTTLGGNYDLGVVKLGLGVQTMKYVSQGTATDTFFGVVVPVGALNVGLDFGNTKLSDTGATTDGTSTTWGLQAVYSLSKLTNIRFRYASYDDVMNPANKSSYSQLALYKNF